MKALRIKGRVFSGKGEGARFTELPWVRMQMKDNLGFTPHPGTLNLKITKNDLKKRNMLKEMNSIEIFPAVGFDRGILFKAKLRGDLKCAIIIPRTSDYPEDVIEIVAEANLRERLKLEDGEAVEVQILIE